MDFYSFRAAKHRAQMDRIEERKRQEKERKQKEREEKRARKQALLNEYRQEKRDRIQEQELREQEANKGPQYDPAVCYACGDKSRAKYRRRPVCIDCYDELMFGTVRNSNVSFFGGVRVKRKDDLEPWQENAIRALEDQ